MSKRNTDVDVGLAALVHHASPYRVLSAQDIADVCACSKGYILELEHKALAKLRRSRVLRAHHAEQDC